MAAQTPVVPVDEEDFVVNHERVAGKINYTKLIERFGSQPIPQSLVDRVERLTNRPAHPFLRRGFFFSHRYVLSYPLVFESRYPHWRSILELFISTPFPSRFPPYFPYYFV
jgi:hypothetical protein